MVNTLRRKKDKDTPAVIDTNGSMNIDSSQSSVPALISTSTQAPAMLQTPSSLASVEEKSRTVAAPLKVSYSLHLLFVWISYHSSETTLFSALFPDINLSQHW